MKASEIKPTSWTYGINQAKTTALIHKWEGIIKKTKSMEENLLKLMNNPKTTPDQLMQASKLYTEITQRLSDHANMVDNYIYHGTTSTI